MSFKKKIFYSLNLGMFITGIILSYNSFFNDNIIRNIMAGVFIGLSYIMFPFIDRNKKDKIVTSFGFHLLAFIVALASVCIVISIYSNNPVGAVWWKEYLAIILMLYSVSFTCYTLICFIRAVYVLIRKTIAKANDNDESKYNSIKHFFERTTAFIVAASALLGSVTGLIVAVKGLIKVG